MTRLSYFTDPGARRNRPGLRRPAKLFCAAAALALFCSLLTPLAARAQDVEQSLQPKQGTVDDIFELQISVTSKRKPQLTMPVFHTSRNFTIQSVGTSTQLQFINGVQQSRVTFNFRVMPDPQLRPGTHRLPDAQFTVDGKPAQLDGAEIVILEKQGGQRAANVKISGIEFAQSVDNETPYVGQQISYRADVTADASFLGGTLEDIDFKGFWREELPDNDKQTRQHGRFTVRTFREVLIPKKDGQLEIPPRVLAGKFSQPRQRRSAGGGFFNDPFFSDTFFDGWPLLNPDKTVERRITAPAVLIHAKPLPPAPPHAGSYIPVGSLELIANVDKKQVNQGESITLKLILSGSANLRPFELPAPSGADADFRRYEDKPDLKTGFDGRLLTFTKTFNVALVPVKAGELALPSYRIVFFNPEEGRYHTLETPPVAVHVRPSSSEQQLQITRPPQPSAAETERPEEQKREITVVGEDLLPQHVGAPTLLPAPRAPFTSLILVLLLGPAAGIALHLHLKKKRLIADDPALLAEREAAQKAFLSLTALRARSTSISAAEAVDALRLTVQTYLTERLRCPVQSMTAKEISGLLQKRIADSGLARQSEEILAASERFLYSGAAAAGSQWQSLLDSTERLISGMEARLQKRKR